jgi:hypothetical protein
MCVIFAISSKRYLSIAREKAKVKQSSVRITKVRTHMPALEAFYCYACQGAKGGLKNTPSSRRRVRRCGLVHEARIERHLRFYSALPLGGHGDT